MADTGVDILASSVCVYLLSDVRYYTQHVEAHLAPELAGTYPVALSCCAVKTPERGSHVLK